MKGQKFAAIAIAVTLGLGFTWFQPQKKEKAPSSAVSSNRQEPTASPRLNASETVAAATNKSPAVSSASSSVQNVSDAAKIVRDNQGIQKQQSTAIAVPNIPSPNAIPAVTRDISPLKDLEVVKIQKQINEIIDANEKFKTLQQSQTDQIRQITEQAQMHRKMLQELEDKNKSSRELKTSDVDEILRQEKMRIIENETEKNKNLLDQISAGKEASAQAASGNHS